MNEWNVNMNTNTHILPQAFVNMFTQTINISIPPQFYSFLLSNAIGWT